MLSIENPPPDLPCSCQILHLKNSSDERESSHNFPLPEVDLSKPPSPLNDHTPLSNFSIRDYVFTARRKDIKTNWPFSLKSLQLCFKHGAKDVLPPFQSTDRVRNQSLKRCMVEASGSSDKQKIRNFDGESCWEDNHTVINSSSNAELNGHIAEACAAASLCRSGEVNDFPSTTTISQSEIESDPVNRPLSPLFETDTLLDSPAEVEAVGPPVKRKGENHTQPVKKKCRLIVKFGANSDRSSIEDISSSLTTVPETMASKVCPVCKTFSSSSNTTLNAHIDQCLSEEPTSKWTLDSKLTRHRIKPRRTRLMDDIYAMAPSCTLEELDRRNGTSWAVSSALPAQETEKLERKSEGKKQRVSLVHPEDVGDVGDVGSVYIDANGTKLRILSKSNDIPSFSKLEADSGPKKSLKGDKGSKLLSMKNKRHAQKPLKHLKLAPKSKKYFSHKAHGSQICGDQKQYLGVERSRGEEPLMMKQFKPIDAGTLTQWMCSKRRGFTKKLDDQDNNYPSRCKRHAAQDFPAGYRYRSLGDSSSEKNYVHKFTNLSEVPVSSPRTNLGMEKLFYEVPVTGNKELSPGRTMVGSPLIEARNSDDVERSLPLAKKKSNKLSKEATSLHDSFMSSSAGNHVSSLSKKSTDISGVGSVAITKSYRSSQAVVPKLLRFSSGKEDALSASSQLPPSGFTSGAIKKGSALKRSQVHLLAGVDKKVLTWHSKPGYGGNLAEELTNEEVSLGRSRRKEAMALNSSRSTSHPFRHAEGVHMDGSIKVGNELVRVGDLESARDEVGFHEDTVIEPSSMIVDVGSFTKSPDKERDKLGKCSNVSSISHHLTDGYDGLLHGAEAPSSLNEPGCEDKQVMYCADEVSSGMIGPNDHLGAELDVEQQNSFPGLDPIPIPGPPGSFLPSPRGVGSVDFQANSSLTTNQVQSPQDRRDLLHGDSSDSLLSAASTVCNTIAGMSDYKYPEPSSLVGPYAVHNKHGSGAHANIKPSVENFDALPPISSTGAYNEECPKLNKSSFERSSFGFKMDDLPCYCQWKERPSQGITLNYQESELLRRRKMASVTVPTIGKQMGYNFNTRPTNLDERFPLSSCPGSEKEVRPIFKSATGSVSSKDSPDAGVTFSTHDDCNSTSASAASNPVLRLMGKNLMVINKEEDASTPHGQSEQLAPNDHVASQLNLMVINKEEDASTPHGQSEQLVPNDHVASQFPAISRSSPVGVEYQEGHYFHSMVPQGSLIFGQDHSTMGQWSTFRSHCDLESKQGPERVAANIFIDPCMGGSFGKSLEPPMHEGDSPNRLANPKNRLVNKARSMLDRERGRSRLDQECKHADSSPNHMKEIIVIDDTPEGEGEGEGEGKGTVSTANVAAKYSDDWRGSQVVFSGKSNAATASRRLINPLPCYQSRDLPLPDHHRSVLQNSNFHATTSRIGVGSSGGVRWSTCIKEGSGSGSGSGSGVLPQGLFMGQSPTTVPLRSVLYYSPS
ncbi:hypothetical protein HS088_TW21G00656 [Tripterygium wilfordii]|uniref:Uncharacterized protein n=1 Tax=Tripterygium wilfordii TaxID=458696 RepID=A0A7J7C319_TRIWF|nr:uncharacterized protein LOC119988157 [Tripterygium wilfordii]XP_038689024.1 uncharacterized protein LOC119988157 [Tripterygium wilfordii]KAF5728508.1 hypothetical protein HS088_TW21G00656 [Tripterygium wilfordii]